MALVPIKVPKVSESISEGILASWLKPDGSTVKAGEPLFELETDKASQVFIAPGAGTLKIQVKEGETVQVESVIGTIDPDATPAAKAPETRQAPRPRSRPKLRRSPPPSTPTAAGAWPPCPSPRPSGGSSPSRRSTRRGSKGPAEEVASPRGTSSPTSRPRRRRLRPPRLSAPPRSPRRPRLARAGSG